jgi:hypothetical protein
VEQTIQLFNQQHLQGFLLVVQVLEQQPNQHLNNQVVLVEQDVGVTKHSSSFSSVVVDKSTLLLFSIDLLSNPNLSF